MRQLAPWMVVVALVAGMALPALAEEPCAAPARIEVIPAHVKCVERQVVVPAVTCERQVPVYETVMVPTRAQVCVPVYEQVEVPVWKTREVPVYRTVNEPIWQQCQVPKYEEVCKQRKMEIWNPFGCENLEIDLWKETECVPCGTETKMMIVGYEPRQVPCGTRLERYQDGTQVQTVLRGYRNECVQTGERPERRLTGWRMEQVVIRPESTQQVTERVEVPCQVVTVAPDHLAPMTTALPATARVLSETEFVLTVLQAR